jgi:hypothetical protein
VGVKRRRAKVAAGHARGMGRATRGADVVDVECPYDPTQHRTARELSLRLVDQEAA